MDRCRARGHAAAGKLRGARARARRASGRSRTRGATSSATASCDHAIKEALPRRTCRARCICEFCGNQRSIKGARRRACSEAQVRDLIKFEKSVALRRPPEGRARLRRGDHLAARHRRRVLGAHVPALQRSRTGRTGVLDRADDRPAELWLRLLNIEHHQVLAGTAMRRWRRASRRARRWRHRKQSRDYWASPRQSGTRPRHTLRRRLVMTTTRTAIRYLGGVRVPSHAGGARAGRAANCRQADRDRRALHPGSPTDVIARIVGERLTATRGQPVIVDNKPGAGSPIGIRETARAEPAGYTLVVVFFRARGEAHALQGPAVRHRLKDFAGVALLGTCRAS